MIKSVKKPFLIKISVVNWSKPEQGKVKLNSDGCLEANKMAGGDGFIKTSSGDFALGFYDFYGECSILETEVKAIIMGIKLL